jgi:NAD(P)-dependent dehydrogenase (short-subunit alcohol dehydrogenase family)
MLDGVYYTIEAALPAMLEHGQGGAIVITSSTAGLNGLCPHFSLMSHGFAGYTAAKHGVVGLMRYYATALAEKNIRVNTVHPGGVATPMVLNEELDQFLRDRPEALPALQGILRAELMEAGDISEAMVYLCGQSGRFITGVTLPVDGGLGVRK